jgi:glutamate-ammonia-ligase adenylyltransferase
MTYTREELTRKLNPKMSQAHDLETQLDTLRLFKKQQMEKIQKEDLEGKCPLPEVFLRLSNLADTLLASALKLAMQEMIKTFGFPTFIDSDGNLMRSEFAVVAMGKLGGQEIHYSSDLDLIFLYSRNGLTEGRKEIPNREYYARLTQKFISYLSVYTVVGSAYKIDTQLRPSGNQGTLVSSIDAYADYQRNRAQAWEKQALLKARYVAGDDSFGKTLADQFKQFIFSTKFPPNFHEEIHRLRMRMEQEIARETPRRLHYKLGPGGLTDIEFAVQYLQLKMGKIFEGIIVANTLEAIQKMGERGILKKDEFKILHDGYLFYRKLETRMETLFDLKAGYIDPQSSLLENLSESIGELSQRALLDKFKQIRHDVRKVYLRILQQGVSLS